MVQDTYIQSFDIPVFEVLSLQFGCVLFDYKMQDFTPDVLWENIDYLDYWPVAADPSDRLYNLKDVWGHLKSDPPPNWVAMFHLQYFWSSRSTSE